MEMLKDIGLTPSEQKVYMALLEIGDSTRGQIVNKSGVAGSKIYELLEKLQDKGLVSIYAKDNIKHFKPTSPYQLLNYLEKKKLDIMKTETETKNILPRLLAIYNSSKEDQEVELLTGLKGLEVVFREQVEILKSKDTCYVIGGTKGSEEQPVIAFFEKIHLMREQKGIYSRMLFNKRQKSSTEKHYSSKKYPKTSTRYIDHSSPVAINIYKNRTAIIIFASDITTIHIKSEDVAKSFVEYFEILWKISGK